MAHPCLSRSWSSELEQWGGLLPRGPGFLLLGLPLPLEVLSALSGPLIVPFVEKLLCQALLNCLELGTSVPVETTRLGYLGEFAQGSQM